MISFNEWTVNDWDKDMCTTDSVCNIEGFGCRIKVTKLGSCEPGKGGRWIERTVLSEYTKPGFYFDTNAWEFISFNSLNNRLATQSG